MLDIGPPIGLIAVGLILWLAVTATIAGISIQTIGLILFVIGVVWLVIEPAINRPRRTVATRERVVDLGPVKVDADKQHSLPIAPIAGIGALIGGIALVVVGSRTRV